jgi:hypothetical protein
MEPPPALVFHPGRLPSTKQKKIPPKASVPAERNSWYILPDTRADDYYMHFTLRSAGKHYTEAVSAITAFKPGFAYGIFFQDAFPFIERCLHLLEVNRRMRWAVSRLLKRWLLLRKVRRMNEEDIVTLDIPRQPITIIDWPARKLYVYEASTVARDVRECLLQRDYMFPAPLQPRNLLTNQALTPMQCLSAFWQLRATGKRLHWSIAAYQGEGYTLAPFKVKFDTALRHEVLKTLFSQPTNDDTIGIVYDFISDEHAYRGKAFPNITYAWALHHAASATRICEWRRLAFRHHQLTIELADESEREDRRIAEIDPHIGALCTPPVELSALRNAWKLGQITGEA